MKKLLLFLFSAFAFAACEQAPIEEAHGVADSNRSLSVSFEGDDTRIQLQNGKTVWTKGDHVSVFYRSTVNEEWQFDGKTGDRIGNIVPVDNTLNPPVTHNRVVVIYPYNNEYYLNTETYSIEASLPAVQNYLEDSYGTNGNIMVSSGNYKQVSLKSVCGWLKLQLTGDGEVVKSITFKGNNGEQVAGLVYVDATTAEATLATAKHNSDDNSQLDGTLVLDDSIYTEVTLDCGEGVALGKNATAFYIALPPQTFENGFTVEIEDTEGYVMEQSTDKALIIERNHIQPMAAFEFINPNRPTQPTPASNQIWYTATAKVDPYFDDFLTFGSNVDSNVWDSETKRGIITFDGDVTMIGDDAFYNCDKFTGITLPECVTSIGKKAFYDCDGLTEFTIPDSVTEIGSSAFYTCDKLTSVTIGDSVTTIGEAAFYSCESLTGVNIPDSVTTIGNRAFISCNSLTSVNIPDSVTEIGRSAFYNCDSLTSVNIPDSVTTIGDSVFACCSSFVEFKGKFASEDGRCLVVDGILNSFAPGGLTEYTIPDSVTTIGYCAFEYCTSLTSVNIPDSVTEIGSSAFYRCTSLTSVNIPDSVTSIGSSAFSNCSSLTSVNIPDSVTTIGEWAFSSCKSLTSVNIPDSVTMIGEWAFYACQSLTSVNIPDSVTSIGNYAFSGCDSLTSVNIPDSVTEIGREAFYSCSSLKKVYCYATIPPSWGSYAFSSNASARRIYVYEECVELYKSAWSYYKDSIYTNGQNCPDTTIIEYSTNDGNTITSSKLPIISNIYDNGVGTMVVVGKIAQIPSLAFENCTSLTSVTIPDSVTTIGDEAFYYCTRLTSVTIGNSVTEIGYEAFWYCTNLTSVYCKATTPPALGGTYVFDSNGSGRKIYVPAGSVETYKSATEWSAYASDIVGYNF